MIIDKVVVLAVLSVVSAVVSGYMLYRSNKSKDKTKVHIETLEAEEKFRDQLMDNISRLNSDFDEISEENEKLKEELYTLRVNIKNLEMIISEKIDKCKVIENFLSHLTTPAWVRLIDKNREYRFAYVNFAFCNYFDVSIEYCMGQHDHSFISSTFEKSICTYSDNVLAKKIGTRGNIEIDGKILSLLKFPIIEGGVIIGIGGILINCAER